MSMNIERLGRALAALLPAAVLCACTSHRIDVEPIEVKPIHITVDVNVKVQRELDEFFAFEDKVDPARTDSEGTTPANGERRKAP